MKATDSLYAAKQSSGRGYYNSQNTAGSGFLPPLQASNRPPDFAALQLQMNNLEALVKEVLQMALPQQGPNLLNYQQFPQHLQKC